eukprot:TRINITY_DN10108_c0_g1_i1.p2 TRINITY_DN10108_c0_g1~~TRINITY_DN10108_c0_g1_i1.p2  ORF type:complete len:125 (+),score=5.00 TRINITY_DN10108_c0_g1_i1:298-672(+)
MRDFIVVFCRLLQSLREMLRNGLKEIGICGNMSNLLRALYANVSCQVVASESLINTFPSTMGVQQVCPLFALLFGLRINKLEEELYLSTATCPTVARTDDLDIDVCRRFASRVWKERRPAGPRF